MATEDEQRVVDTHAQSDHGAQPRGHGGHLDQSGQQTDGGQPGQQPGRSGEERQCHRRHGAEGHEEDDERGDHPDGLSRPGRFLLQDRRKLTAELDLHTRTLGRGTAGDERVQRRMTQVGGGAVVLQRRHSGAAVRGDCARGRERVGDRDDVRQRLEVGNRGRDGIRGAPRVDRGGLRVEDHHRGRAGPFGEPLAEEVDCLLRLDTGNLEGIHGLAADGAVRDGECRKEQDPAEDHQPPAPSGSPADPVQPVRHSPPSFWGSHETGTE